MNQLENDEEMNNNNNKVSITKTSNYLIFFLYSKMENFLSKKARERERVVFCINRKKKQIFVCEY